MDVFLTANQNVSKICWNMYQVMHEDPRRRFVHAFTIENTSMRIWFASRTEMIVSKWFNFITVRVRLLFAVRDIDLAAGPR